VEDTAEEALAVVDLEAALAEAEALEAHTEVVDSAAHMVGLAARTEDLEAHRREDQDVVITVEAVASARL